MLLSALALLGTPAPSPPPAVPQREEIKTSAMIAKRRVAPDRPAPIELASARLQFSSAPPAGAPELPEELHGAAWSQVVIGGNPVYLVLGRAESEGEAPTVLWIDLDASRRFGDGERVELAPEGRETPDGGTSWSASVQSLEAKSAGTVFPFAITYWLNPGRPLAATIAFLDWREAGLTLDGREYTIALLDADHDGSCAGEADRWFLFRAAEPPERAARAFALSAFSEGRFLDGRRFTVRVDDCSDLEIVARVAEGADPADLAHHRERVERAWFQTFDGERDTFVESRAIDTTRPRADRPIPWRYLSFAEAVELAAREEKPLFVDVMAFWCVWCYRLDYYTYVDAEVARLLREEFVPVKIVQEQAAAGDFELVLGKIEERGLPAMGVFDARGELLTKISGWKKPEEFVAELEKGLAAYRGEGN